MIGQSQHQLRLMQNREILWYGIVSLLVACGDYLLYRIVVALHGGLW